MKKILNSECFRKRCAQIAAVIVGLVIAVSVCIPIHAASATGIIVCGTCYAKLNVNGSSVTATTLSSSNTYNYVSVTCRYYYTDSDGNLQIGEVTSQNSGSGPVSAIVYAHGNNIRIISVRSSHSCVWGSYIWSVNLEE